MSLSEVNPVKCVMEEKKKGRKKEEEQIAKYRELLQSIQDKDRKEKDKDMEMEITWVPGTAVQHVVFITGTGGGGRMDGWMDSVVLVCVMCV